MTLGSETYTLDRLELVHCPQVRVDGIDPTTPLARGQELQLAPQAESTFRAVELSAAPAADHGPFT